VKGDTSKSTGKSELRGAPLDVVRELLGEGRTDDVLAVVAALVSRNRELEMLLASMRESKNRGERISSEQLALFTKRLEAQSGGELAEADQKLKDVAAQNGGRAEPSAPAKQPPVRRPLPSTLRRVKNEITVPESERPCPQCGAVRTCIAHETTEVAELIPAEVIVRQDIREVLACRKCDAEVVRAPMGDKVIAGGAYGSYLVADLVVGKYWDSLPLNRQGQKLERLGLSIPSSSMADQITWATDRMRPVYELLRVQTLLAGVMHVDATSIPVRDRDSPTGIHVGSLWGYVGDQDVAVYLYTSTGKKVGQRPGELGPEQFLALRRGPVVADASNLFDTSFQGGERMEVGCNMHYLECGVIRRRARPDVGESVGRASRLWITGPVYNDERNSKTPGFGRQRVRVAAPDVRPARFQNAASASRFIAVFDVM
jgi:transposase